MNMTVLRPKSQLILLLLAAICRLSAQIPSQSVSRTQSAGMLLCMSRLHRGQHYAAPCGGFDCRQLPSAA